MHIDMDAYIYESHIFGNMEVYMLKSPSIFSASSNSNFLFHIHLYVHWENWYKNLKFPSPIQLYSISVSTWMFNIIHALRKLISKIGIS